MSDIPEVGKTYKVVHSRKGTFFMRVTKVIPDQWTYGVIVEGMADAMMDYNRKYVGDEISVRHSLALFYVVEEKK